MRHRRRAPSIDRVGTTRHRWAVSAPAAALLPGPHSCRSGGDEDDAPAGRPADPGAGSKDRDCAQQPVTSAQVFIDGYYVGTTDVEGTLFELEAGPHRVELKANGYEAVDFDVRIVAQQSITYRDTLKVSRRSPDAAPVPPEAAAAHTTLYVIPGCYAGNQPPDSLRLAEGCDSSRVIVKVSR